MTPKEKANELVDKNYDEMFYLRDGYNSSDIFKTAKQCALIAVDELINHCHVVNIVYWQEVKHEINLL